MVTALHRLADTRVCPADSFCPLFNCSRPIGPNCAVVPGWGPCGHSVEGYEPRLEWARSRGFINRTIFFFGWMIARSPLVPHGWTPESLRAEATRLQDRFPEMPGMGLYTSGRIAHPMTQAQQELLRAGSDLMAQLYPSNTSQPSSRLKADDDSEPVKASFSVAVDWKSERAKLDDSDGSANPSRCPLPNGTLAPCGPGNEQCTKHGRFTRSPQVPQYHLMDLSCGEQDPNGPIFDPVHAIYHHFCDRPDFFDTTPPLK